MMRSVSVVANASGRLRRALRNAIGPSTFVPSASTPPVSIGEPSGIVSRHCPTGLNFSRAKPGGSMTRWHDAHVGELRCSSSWALTVFGAVVAPLALSSSVGTFGSGGGGGVFRNVLRMNLPRYTGEVLVATDVSERRLPWPS